MSLILQNVAPERLDCEALTDPRTSYSWREVGAIIDRATHGILDHSAPGQRVGVFARNSAEGALAYTAALAAGRASVPINSQLSASELLYILDDAQVDLLFVGPECQAAAAQAIARRGHGTLVAWRCEPSPGTVPWEEWLAGQRGGQPPVDMPPAPHLHYTSGTTGQPKAVETPPTMFPTCATVRELFEALGEQVRTGVRGACLAVAPLYHTSPLRLVRAFAGGCKLVTLDGFDPEQVLTAIEEHRIERSVMVPTHFRRLLSLSKQTRAGYDVSSLKFISHTGAACPADVKRDMIEWIGPVLTEFYGGTETGPACLINSHEALEHPGSVGRAAPPFEALVIGENGEELPCNTEGKLYFRDTTGRGIIYANDPEKTRQSHIAPAVFTLGEIGYIDEQGYVFITDRSSDMIVSGGVNIYPAEIEQQLIKHEAIEDAAVIGVPNNDMGEEVKALVILKPGAARPAFEDLDRFCREELAGYKCPRSFDFVASIGRNAMGKISKRALRSPFWPTARTIG